MTTTTDRPEFRLRDYQVEARDKTIDALRRGDDPLFVLATGLGKTEIIIGVVAQYLADNPAARILVLADRDHLVNNPFERFALRAPEFIPYCGMVKAEDDDADAKILFGSVQTLARPNRLRRVLESGPVDLIITDEAHRAVTSQHRTVVDAIRRDNAAARHAGCTATAKRTDGANILDDVFSTVVVEKDARWGMRNGYLVPARCMVIQTGVRFAGKVRSTKGDYRQSDLVKVFDVDNVVELIVATHKEYSPDRKGITFVPSVDMAYRLAAEYTKEGFPAEAADGTVPKAERAAILERFRKGETVMLCCYPGLWGEGLDLPELKVVHMAFPTRSAPRWQQCAGRGLRPAAWVDKQDCMIVDYVPRDDNRVYTSAQALLDSAGQALVEEAKETRERVAPEDDGFVTGFLFDGDGFTGLEGDPLAIVAKEVEFVRSSSTTWQRIPEERLVVLGLGPDRDDTSRTLVVEPTNGLDDNYRLQLVKMPHYTSGLPSEVVELGTGTFADMTTTAQEYADYNANVIFLNPGAAWRHKEASPGQVKLLRYRLRASGYVRENIGVESLDDLSRGQASDVITAIKSLQVLGRYNPSDQ